MAQINLNNRKLNLRESIMKLSSLSPEQKTKLLAELDGYYNLAMQTYTSNRTRPFEQELGWFGNKKPFDERQTFLVPYYSTSYDAIILLIRKLVMGDEVKESEFLYALSRVLNSGFVKFKLIGFTPIEAAPSQLCDAVLVATGKCEL